jgi:hypothetical protein
MLKLELKTTFFIAVGFSPKPGGDFIDNRSLILTLVILAAQEIFDI